MQKKIKNKKICYMFTKDVKIVYFIGEGKWKDLNIMSLGDAAHRGN